MAKGTRDEKRAGRRTAPKAVAGSVRKLSSKELEKVGGGAVRTGAAPTSVRLASARLYSQDDSLTQA